MRKPNKKTRAAYRIAKGAKPRKIKPRIVVVRLNLKEVVRIVAPKGLQPVVVQASPTIVEVVPVVKDRQTPRTWWESLWA